MTLSEISGATVACMATYPARHAGLEPVVKSLASQVDWLFIYANESVATLPDLSHYRNVVVLDSNEHRGDLSASGKIFPLSFLRNCYVFTVDDDFVYPSDYVHKYKEILDAFDKRCCITTHGSIFVPHPRWYYVRQKVFAAQSGYRDSHIVALGGSGTFAFHQSTLNVSFEDFLPEVMVDLVLSLAARRRSLPIWTVPRPEGWLRHLGGEGLWHTYKRTITHHTMEARRHDWSFEAYRQIARASLAMLEEKRSAGLAPRFRLDPELTMALETGEPPSTWRNGRETYVQRKRYMDILNKALEPQEAATE